MALKAWLAACFAFLYAPILFLVVFSFNDARLVTQWVGFSTRWYGVLWHDQPMIDAALLSLRIAALSATLACVLGAAGGLVMARFGPFRGRMVFAACLAVPLVMPEVITGLSLLLLFVALEQLTGWPPGRGALTVTLAHASVSFAYVAVVIRARLADTGEAVEQAAMDLYAPPWKAFVLITLPLMTPALVTGWLLAFTLSMDDVVVASFTSGPGASTLPMVVFSMTRLGTTPEIYALATVIVGVVAATLIMALLVGRSLMPKSGN
ncbi:MAG: ABC transporter permease subunit [Rhodopila sp.]